MKRYNKFIFILFVTAILSGIATSLEAQDKPKKKKNKHVQITNYIEGEIKNKIEKGEMLLDADFSKALKNIVNKQSKVS